MRDACMEQQRGEGVLATFHYVPLHSSPFGRALGAAPLELPVTDRVAGGLLRLPLHPLLRDEEVERVIDAVRRFRA
jgi:dTDP-4-amino-4,6-dideoxygalactose transaminase